MLATTDRERKESRKIDSSHVGESDVCEPNESRSTPPTRAESVNECETPA